MMRVYAGLAAGLCRACCGLVLGLLRGHHGHAAGLCQAFCELMPGFVRVHVGLAAGGEINGIFAGVGVCHK